jgi:hypothetical protein
MLTPKDIDMLEKMGFKQTHGNIEDKTGVIGGMILKIKTCELFLQSSKIELNARITFGKSQTKIFYKDIGLKTIFDILDDIKFYNSIFDFLSDNGYYFDIEDDVLKIKNTTLQIDLFQDKIITETRYYRNDKDINVEIRRWIFFDRSNFQSQFKIFLEN